MALILLSSEPLAQCDELCPDPITLFAQFYIDAVKYRYEEIKYCLRKNVENPSITRIVLLNERVYSPLDLGLSDDQMAKIEQVVIGTRLKYRDVFTYVSETAYAGYFAIANSDIFFDDSIERIRRSDLHTKRKMLALLRYEFAPKHTPVLFGPRYDSQDVWVFHTAQPVSAEFLKALTFPLGKPACDNKIAYLLKADGFDIVNDPLAVKTYHYHVSQLRRYTAADTLKQPWCAIIPANVPREKVMDSLGMRIANMDGTSFDDNDRIYNYIRRKIQAGEPFVIPRMSTVETSVATLFAMMHDTSLPAETRNMAHKTLDQASIFSALKTNAGIRITSDESMVAYSAQYLDAFRHCEMLGIWGKNTHMYKYVHVVQEYIQTHLCPGKEPVCGFAFDIYHYIHREHPWTHALRGKRVLIVSPFEDTLKKQLEVRNEIYGRDLFPDCTFLTIKPPQTQGTVDAPDFRESLAEFFRRLDQLDGQYDVALASCGGYGSLVVDYIFRKGVSAIYVGGVLQMYFGIMGKRWYTEREDIVRMYLNKHWCRPAANEKPPGSHQIENACYW